MDPKPHASFRIIKAPDPVPVSPQKTIFLAGSITPKWRSTLSTLLSHLPCTVLNPYRPDWDSSWDCSLSNPAFHQQVTWELDHARDADVVAFYLAPGVPSPVSMLELGLLLSAAKEGRGVVVCAPEGFPSRGNVEVVCKRFQVPMVGGLGELAEGIKEQLGMAGDEAQDDGKKIEGEEV